MSLGRVLMRVALIGSDDAERSYTVHERGLMERHVGNKQKGNAGCNNGRQQALRCAHVSALVSAYLYRDQTVLLTF